jgi:hypothetical protein
LFIEKIYNWLDRALDSGIKENEFWFMTLAEIERAINSSDRVRKDLSKQQAIFDYTLANLIGRSVARIKSDKVDMPKLSQVYPSLFDAIEEENAIQEQKDNISALRFKIFAQSHNENFKEVCEADG